MATRKGSLSKSDKVIQWHVSRCQQNLLNAFDHAASELGYSPEYCRRRWYKYLRQQQAQFTTHGKTSFPNIKNVWRGFRPPNVPIKGKTNKQQLIDAISWLK